VFQDTGFGLAIGGKRTFGSRNKIIQNKDGMFISEQAQLRLRNNVIENNQRDGTAIAYCSQAQLLIYPVAHL